MKAVQKFQLIVTLDDRQDCVLAVCTAHKEAMGLLTIIKGLIKLKTEPRSQAGMENADALNKVLAEFLYDGAPPPDAVCYCHPNLEYRIVPTLHLMP